MTEPPAYYNPGYTSEELNRQKLLQKVKKAIANLERQGVGWAEVLEAINTIAKEKGVTL